MCYLKKMRLDRGMTQGELAIAVGCTAQQISNYETERLEPHPKKRLRIAQYLGCAPSDIWPLVEKTT